MQLICYNPRTNYRNVRKVLTNTKAIMVVTITICREKISSLLLITIKNVNWRSILATNEAWLASLCTHAIPQNILWRCFKKIKHSRLEFVKFIPWMHPWIHLRLMIWKPIRLKRSLVVSHMIHSLTLQFHILFCRINGSLLKINFQLDKPKYWWL